jgi:DNA-binding winged helix-turn-helix (wHTH) protein/tetratricopeptide (TPR) repeat protein/tRNA A-37 threonylcarbamoyl transferase component Bud32
VTDLRVESADLTGRRWVFGSAELDERSLELRVDGEQVMVERKPLEVLIYLLHHAGEVVTKDDLAENLWPGRVLTETVLTRCISQLRQALKDDDKTLIRTAHGYGYRLVAKVKVESTADAPPPALDFKPADSPPTRPQWRLVERLGTGGHGEAWLARHDKTGDARVFKFAVDAGALSSLKREITLYRLLHDSLGARAAVARILEWNLEEAPYFIEMEYVAGGNLQAWCEVQGGLAGMPLTARVELVAQIAEAVAAAHSVGALHKDLKPGNVLIQVEDGKPKVKLCDFGSGAVLDPQRLEALGITRLGFTKTVQGSASATPLYLAPEVIAGQPFTTQADIYSLGILLYQVVTCDLRRSLAPGWEADVEDELLREDIGAAAAGNLARRLTDAAQLAERLRSLDARREARAAEVAARARAERVRRVQEELRRTRVFLVALAALTAVAVSGGFVAYRARDAAVEATATAKAVSDFLMEDVLRTDSGLLRPSETSYEAMLQRAAAEVGIRLKDQPAAAAKIHMLLGRRYQEFGRFEAALEQYERAVALSTELYGGAAESTLVALDRLAWVYLESGRTTEALTLAERIRSLWESQLLPADPAILMVRCRVARIILVGGDYATAEHELRAAIAQAASVDRDSEQAKRLVQQWLGISSAKGSARDLAIAYGDLLLGANVLEETGDDLAEAEVRVRNAHSSFSKNVGEESELTSIAGMALAIILGATGQTAEAEKHALLLPRYWDKALPAGHFAHALPLLAMGRVRMEQRRFSEATALFEKAVGLCTRDAGCPQRFRAELQVDLGMALKEDGRWQAALEFLRASLDVQRRIFPPHHSILLRTQIAIADALRQGDRLDEASSTLSEIGQGSTAVLKAQARAELRGTEGLILLQEGHVNAAVTKLQEAAEIHTRRAGAMHWRTQRARADLQAAKEAAASPRMQR